MIYLQNKKGLSAIIITLIMIVLSLVAVGIIWVIVNNVLTQGTEDIGSGSRCLDVSVRATKLIEEAVVSPATTPVYTLTVSRDAKGDTITGVKVVLLSSTANTGVITKAVSISPLETKTISLATADTGNFAAGANNVEVTPYFLDDSGNEKLCSTQSFNF